MLPPDKQQDAAAESDSSEKDEGSSYCGSRPGSHMRKLGRDDYCPHSAPVTLICSAHTGKREVNGFDDLAGMSHSQTHCMT